MFEKQKHPPVYKINTTCTLYKLITKGTTIWVYWGVGLQSLEFIWEGGGLTNQVFGEEYRHGVKDVIFFTDNIFRDRL